MLGRLVWRKDSRIVTDCWIDAFDTAYPDKINWKTAKIMCNTEAELLDIIIDAGESAKTLERPGMARLQAMVHNREVQTVIIAKLDRLTRSVKDLAEFNAALKASPRATVLAIKRGEEDLRIVIPSRIDGSQLKKPASQDAGPLLFTSDALNPWKPLHCSGSSHDL